MRFVPPIHFLIVGHALFAKPGPEPERNNPKYGIAKFFNCFLLSQRTKIKEIKGKGVGLDTSEKTRSAKMGDEKTYDIEVLRTRHAVSIKGDISDW